MALYGPATLVAKISSELTHTKKMITTLFFVFVTVFTDVLSLSRYFFLLIMMITPRL